MTRRSRSIPTPRGTTDIALALKRAEARRKSELEARLFIALCKQQHVVPPVVEWMFATDIQREWRFDFAWPESKVALEVEGGIFSHGGHTRAAGFAKDVEKYNAAAVRGWLVLRCAPGAGERIERHKRTGKIKWQVAGLLAAPTLVLVTATLALRRHHAS